MGWLSKIFKASDHKVSEGHYHNNNANYKDAADSYTPSTSGDVWPKSDDEDIDRAIALSLVEENQKGNGVNGNGTPLGTSDICPE